MAVPFCWCSQILKMSICVVYTNYIPVSKKLRTTPWSKRSKRNSLKTVTRPSQEPNRCKFIKSGHFRKPVSESETTHAFITE